MEEVLYGLPLALIQLRKEDRARIALNRAIRTYPLIAGELLKSKSVKPRNLDESQVTLGGADQAYLYRKMFHNYWKHTPGALDLLRQCLEAHEKFSPPGQ